jgi:hypothetical protein
MITKEQESREPGTVPPGRLGVYDGKGNYRGHVGHRAGAATAARFINRADVKLGTKDGRQAWVCPRARATGATVAPVCGTDGGRAASLRAAKGSNK